MRQARRGAAPAARRQRPWRSILLLLIPIVLLLLAVLLISRVGAGQTSGGAGPRTSSPASSIGHDETLAAANNGRRTRQRRNLDWAQRAAAEMTNDMRPRPEQARASSNQVIQRDRHEDEINTSTAAARRRHKRQHRRVRRHKSQRRAQVQARVLPLQPAATSERANLVGTTLNYELSERPLPSREDGRGGDGGQKRLINLIRFRRHQQTAAAPTNSSSATRNRSSKEEAEERVYVKRLEMLRQKYMTNRAISDRAYYVLLAIYALFIIFGTVSNFLICLTVVLKPKILSPRNIFIVNLAGSDLLLCVFTMPFSFIELSMKMWQMGLITCKLVAGLQATSIFVSTISITAIALDRYKVIVYPTHQERASGARGAALLLASVWFGALVLSLPLFGYRTVEQIGNIVHNRPPSEAHLSSSANGSSSYNSVAAMQASAPLDSSGGGALNNNSNSGAPSGFLNQLLNPSAAQSVEPIEFCIEKWPFNHGRGFYSVVSMIFQYVLPITIVSIVYTKISRKLQKRLIRRQQLTQLQCHQKRQLHLIRRTHTMLVSVSLVFGLSWLPLNLLNVISDFSPKLLSLVDDQSFRIIFAICHLIGCSSACSNPILYGFLNENFRKEFRQVYDQHARILTRLMRRLFCCCLKPSRDSNKNNNYNYTTRQQLTARNEHDFNLQDKPNSSAANLQLELASTISKRANNDDDDLQQTSKSARGKINSFTSSTSNSSDSSSETTDTGNSSMSNSLDLHDDDDDEGEQISSSESLVAPARSLTNAAAVAATATSLASLQLNATAQDPRSRLTRSLSATNNQTIIEPADTLLRQAGRHGHLLSVPSRDDERDERNEQEERKFSFQTITSGRQVMGKTMRLCFCLSDSSSSSETLGRRPSRARPASIQLDQLNGSAENHVASPARRAAAAERKRRRRHKRRERLRARHQQLQLECACHCHRQAVEGKPVKERSRLKAAVNNNTNKQEADQQQAKLGSRPAGKRVWLRFLGGGLSSSSREDETPPPMEAKELGPPLEISKRAGDCARAKDEAPGEAARCVQISTARRHELGGDNRPGRIVDAPQASAAANGTTYEIEATSSLIPRQQPLAKEGAQQSAGVAAATRGRHCNNCKHSSLASRRPAGAADANGAAELQHSRRRQRRKRREPQWLAGATGKLEQPALELAAGRKQQRRSLRRLTNWLSRSSWRVSRSKFPCDEIKSPGQLVAPTNCRQLANGLAPRASCPAASKQSASLAATLNGDSHVKVTSSASTTTATGGPIERRASLKRSLVASLTSRGENHAAKLEMLGKDEPSNKTPMLPMSALSNKTGTRDESSSCQQRELGKQVGMVYLSIETGCSGGAKGDSTLSLSWRERSTSLVVLEAECAGELEARAASNQQAAEFNQARPASSSGGGGGELTPGLHGSTLACSRAADDATTQINYDDANNLEALKCGHESDREQPRRRRHSKPEATLPGSQSEVCVRLAAGKAVNNPRGGEQIESDGRQEDELRAKQSQAGGGLQSSASSSSSSSYVLSAGLVESSRTSRTSTNNSSTSCLCSSSASCSCHWTQASGSQCTHTASLVATRQPPPPTGQQPRQTVAVGEASNHIKQATCNDEVPLARRPEVSRVASHLTNQLDSNPKASGGGVHQSSAWPASSEPQLATAAGDSRPQTAAAFASGAQASRVESSAAAASHRRRHQSVRATANQRQVPPGARNTRTLSATAGSAAGQAQRAAAAQAATRAAAMRANNAATAATGKDLDSCHSSSLVALVSGGGGGQRPGSQRQSAANLADRSIATTTNNTTSATNAGAVNTTTASSCSLLFTNTTTSRSSFSEFQLSCANGAAPSQLEGAAGLNCSTDDDAEEQERDHEDELSRRQTSGGTEDEETTMAAPPTQVASDWPQASTRQTQQQQHSESATSSSAVVSPRRKVGQPLA